MDLTDDLKKDYTTLLARAKLRPGHIAELDAVIGRIFRTENWKRYKDVSAKTGIPPFVIAIIHSLEASGRFDRHLHNGDPLTARTTHEPPNRPKAGSPPFSWVDSAVDALRDVAQWKDWSLEGICFVFEDYNGFGYRNHHPNVKSPYLWSFTTIYTAGKYIADGRWSDTAVSRQCGGMALLLRMIEQKLIDIDAPLPETNDEPPGRPQPPVSAPAYPGRMIRSGKSGPNVRKIQQQLSDLGIREVGPVDGDFGERTEWAVRLFQARHEDSNGEPLEVDGVVGPITWNSLFGIELDGIEGETPPPPAPVGDLSEAALKIAVSQIGVLEQPKGSNRGDEVDDYMNAVDGTLRGQAWCMAFVYWCFRQATGNAPLRVPKTASVWRSWEMAQEGNIGRIITAKQARAEPELVKPGMVFYIDTGGRHGHTGFVRDIVNGKLLTIEGNTNNDGSREGYGVFQRNKRRIDTINLGFIDFG